jgi:hypothetical protein
MTVKRISPASVAALLAVALLGVMSLPSKASEGGASAPQLEGTWVVEVNGAAGPFKSLVTYTGGGGFIGSPPPVPPPLHSAPAQGTWKRSGGREFVSTFVTLIYDPAGQLVATAKTREVVTLSADGEQSDGRSSTEVFDAAGNPLPQFSLCGQTHATRVRAEPPSPSCP